MSANHFYLALLFTALTQVGLAQNVSINDDGTAPNPYAIIDIDASNNDKGILIPRMTSNQRKDIAGLGAAEEGLIVYEETSKEFWYWDGGNWVQINAQNFKLMDNDHDTEVKVEEAPDEDIIRFDIGGTEKMVLVKNSDNVGRLELINPSGNIFIGEHSGAATQPGGICNTAVGDSCMSALKWGLYSTAMGYRTLRSNQSPVNNTAIGAEAMYANFGNDNTAIGAAAMRLGSGHHNVGVGTGVLDGNSGEYNVGLGVDALGFSNSGSNNTALGAYAMQYRESGSRNVAVGYSALWQNETGTANVAIGYAAQSAGTTGTENVAIGDSALTFNEADWNTAIGHKALKSNTTAADNVAVGNLALVKNEDGESNTGIGTWALFGNVHGSFNTAIGRGAGLTANYLDHCTFIGNVSGSSVANISRSTALGYQAMAYESDQVMIGSATIGSIGGYELWTKFSDGRFKMNVREDVPGLDFVLQLRPVAYQVDVQKVNKFMGSEATTDAERLRVAESTKAVHLGFIAQEVEEAAVNLGFEFPGVDRPDREGGVYALRYAAFVMPLIKAVQEQQAEIEMLQQVNNAQSDRIAALENAFTKIAAAQADAQLD